MESVLRTFIVAVCLAGAIMQLAVSKRWGK